MRNHGDVDWYTIPCSTSNPTCACLGVLKCGCTTAFKCRKCGECYPCKHKLLGSFPKPTWRCRNGTRSVAVTND